MAWAGRSPKSFNPDKFNALGIMNQTRGTNSCGVTVDGKIYHGIDNTSRYCDFLAEGGFPLPMSIPIVIGHTRNSTVGKNTAANAHPFGYGEAKANKELFEFIGVHNGTLYNYKDLAEDNKIDTTKSIINEKNTSFVADKIDSEILLEIIYKSADFKVLSRYNGAAALVFCNVNEPEYIYAFHGASVKSLDGNDKALYIERELWAWQEHKNSLYISSQEHGLQAIGGTKETMTHLQTNTVYKIKHGNLGGAKQFHLSRSAQQHDKISAYFSTQNRNKRKATPVNDALTNAYDNTSGGGTKNKIPFPVRGSKSSIILPDDANIHNDKKMEPDSKRISVQKLRYCRNGHEINGIFIWITNVGLYFIGYNMIQAEKTFKNLIDKQWYKGDFVYDTAILEGAKEKEITIPLKSSLGFKKDSFNCLEHFHFFIDGAKILSYTDWISATSFIEKGNGFSVQALSNITCHPIVDTKYKKGNHEQGIFHNGVLATSPGFTPLGSNKTYRLNKGNCTAITIVDGAKHRTPFSNLVLIQTALELNEENSSTVISLAANSPSSKKSLVDALAEDTLNKLVDELFLPAIETFQHNRDRLRPFAKYELGKDALEINESFLKRACELVMMEIND